MESRFNPSTCLLGLVVAGALVVGACGTSSTDVPTGGAGGDGGLGSGAGVFGGGGGAFGDGGGGKPGSKPPAPCDDRTCTAAGGACQKDVCVIRENPGNVDSGVQGKLEAGGTADSAFAWLYPYDRTIFPRGLLPPTLQFGGTAPDAVYVHVTAKALDYEGFYGASSPARVTFSPAVWTAITTAAKDADDVRIDVTKTSGGAVAGPVTETWRVAQGSLRGTIYYETYDSRIAGGFGSVGIMRIDPGAKAPSIVKSGCGNVCHTASADGSTLVANTGLGTGSASYDLKDNASVLNAASDKRFTYGGLYPDGSLLVSATNYRTWGGLGGLGGGPGGGGSGSASALYDTRTGTKLAAPGWDGVVTNAGTTAFSPDGKHIAFNHEDTGGGHTLASMDFDAATHAFSNLADVANDPQRTLAWPAFTPDSKWLVYHAGSNAQFETDKGATGDLYIVDTATHTTARLDALDGYAGTSSYLPAKDPDLNFAPTVLPEAVGGYFWVVFTSHRSYGNTLASKDHGDEYGKLWVAAIDIDGKAGADVSHPAFFLDGQELDADNLRGFWVLSPCKANGNGCGSGDECCSGYCRGGEDASSSPTCVSPPGGCSNEYEKCAAASDCCDSSMQCINGRCATPAVK